MAHYEWTEEELDRRLKLLTRHGFLTTKDSLNYKPFVMVVSLKDARRLEKLADRAAGPGSIAARWDSIKADYARILAFSNIPFEDRRC